MKRKRRPGQTLPDYSHLYIPVRNADGTWTIPTFGPATHLDQSFTADQAKAVAADLLAAPF